MRLFDHVRVGGEGGGGARAPCPPRRVLLFCPFFVSSIFGCFVMYCVFSGGGVRRRQGLQGRVGWKRFIFVFGEGEDEGGEDGFWTEQ